MLEQMKRELFAQEQLLRQSLKELEQLPGGVLFVRPGKKRDYYYQSINNEGQRRIRYLSLKRSEDRQIIRGLLRKNSLLQYVRILVGNTKALRQCVGKFKTLEIKGVGGYTDDSKLQEGSDAIMRNDNAGQSAIPWSAELYERASMHPETLKVKSINGLWVRSKTESMIALSLDLAGIPFHYEEVLRKGEIVMVPDFTLFHQASGEILYWEHFGMMEDEGYAAEAMRKLKRYLALGIFPGSRLILTMETEAMPLGIDEIRWIIKRYFQD